MFTIFLQHIKTAISTIMERVKVKLVQSFLEEKYKYTNYRESMDDTKGLPISSKKKQRLYDKFLKNKTFSNEKIYKT